MVPGNEGRRGRIHAAPSRLHGQAHRTSRGSRQAGRKLEHPGAFVVTATAFLWFGVWRFWFAVFSVCRYAAHAASPSRRNAGKNNSRSATDDTHTISRAAVQGGLAPSDSQTK